MPSRTSWMRTARRRSTYALSTSLFRSRFVTTEELLAATIFSATSAPTSKHVAQMHGPIAASTCQHLDGIGDDTRNDAAPTRMNGGDVAGGFVGDQNRNAIGGANLDRDVVARDDRVRFFAFERVRAHFDDACRMHLFYAL